MFFMLLLVTFSIAAVVSFVVAKVFEQPVALILTRIVSEELSMVWRRYVKFAIYVVGISGGVRIWQLEKYITPQYKDAPQITLNYERWVLEVYRTVIATLQSLAWMLLVFFLFTLIAYVIVRIFELKHTGQTK